MCKAISVELRRHAPFTFAGAMTGIVIILLSQEMPPVVSRNAFYVLHPLHVVLSALVTASMYEVHKCPATNGKRRLWALLAIGYVGSIGVATLSDCVIPYVGEVLLRLPNRGVHMGFIEQWWLVNPLAVAGIAVAYLRPTTRFPHSGHVLLSTWASLFHILMAVDGSLHWAEHAGVVAFLFLAVWVPCCVSDIVFPLLFVRGSAAGAGANPRGHGADRGMARARTSHT